MPKAPFQVNIDVESDDEQHMLTPNVAIRVRKHGLSARRKRTTRNMAYLRIQKQIAIKYEYEKLSESIDHSMRATPKEPKTYY